MRRFFKSLAILLLALLTILIISTIIIRHYFPPERIKGILLAEAEKAIGRRVSVGEVGISLLHGIDISDIYIGENRSYGDIPFVKVKRVTVGYSFSEIFQKRIVFNRIDIEQPEVHIRSREGKLALSDLIKKPPAEKKPPVEERPAGPPKPFPLTVLLQSCEVRGISLFYDAEDANGSIKGINVSLNGDLYPFGGINVKVSSRDEENIGISAKGLTLNTGLLTNLYLSLKGTDSISLQGKVELKGMKAGLKGKRLRPFDIGLGLDLTGEMNGGAEIKSISVVVGKGSSFILSGSIRELKGLKGVDIKVTGESDLAEVSKIASEFLPIPVSGSFNIAGIRVEGDAPDSLKVKSNMSLNGVKVSNKGINLQVDGSIKAKANSRGNVTLSGMRLNLNNAVTVEASANASKWGKGRVSGRVHVVVDNAKSLALLPEEILKKIGKVGISGMTKVDVKGERVSEKGALKVNIRGVSDLRNLSAGPISMDETAVNFSVTTEDLLKGKVAADAGVKGKGVKVSTGDITLTDEDLDVNITASSPDMFRKTAVVDGGIKVHGVSLKKGDIEFRNERTDVSITGISNDIVEKKTSVEIGIGLRGIKVKKGEIELNEDQLDTTVSVFGDFKKGNILIKGLEVAVPGLVRGVVAGDIKGWGRDLALNTRVDGIDHKRWLEKVPAPIRQKLPKMEVEGESSITAAVNGGHILNITGTFKTKGLGVSLPDKGINVRNSEGSIDFDLSKEVQSISGKVKVGAFQKTGLLDTPVSILAGFEMMTDGPNIKIKNISATIPEKSASFSVSGEVAGYLKEPRPTLDLALSFLSREKVDLLKGVNASGGVSFRGGIKSPREKELELNGGLKFEHLFMSYQDRASVNDLNGEIRMVQGIRYVKGVEIMAQQEGDAPYTGTLYDLMRPYLKKGYDLTMGSASYDEYKIGPLNMDIAWNRGRLLIDRYDLSLFDGGIVGSVRAAYLSGMPEYSLYSNIAGIRFDRIFKGSKGGEDVQVNADLNLKGKGTEIEGDVNVTRIGKDILDRALLRLDPNESNPQIVDIRSKLNTLGWVPKEVSIWIRHGELNLDVTLQRRGFTLLNIVGLEKIPVRRVPLGYLIKKGLKTGVQ